MPSFDVVSEVDMHELTNAIDQANREIDNRFDFKGSGAKFSLDDESITIEAPSEFQVQQMQPILEAKLVKRSLDIQCLEWKDIDCNLSKATQVATIRQGIDKEDAKKITKLIKESKEKVQAAIQGEKVRVTGKKRDDLQSVMSLLKDSNLDIPLQFDNFRD